MQPYRMQSDLASLDELESEGTRWPRIDKHNAAQFEPPKLNKHKSDAERMRGSSPWRWYWQMTGKEWSRDSASYETQTRRWRKFAKEEHKSWALVLDSPSNEQVEVVNRFCTQRDTMLDGATQVQRAAGRKTETGIEVRVVFDKPVSSAVASHKVLLGAWRPFAFDAAEWRSFCQGDTCVLDLTQQGKRRADTPHPPSSHVAPPEPSEQPAVTMEPSVPRQPRNVYTCAGVTLKPPSYWTSLADALPALKVAASPEGEGAEKQLERLQLPDWAEEMFNIEGMDQERGDGHKLMLFLFALRCCAEGLDEYAGIPFRPEKWVLPQAAQRWYWSNGERTSSVPREGDKWWKIFDREIDGRWPSWWNNKHEANRVATRRELRRRVLLARSVLNQADSLAIVCLCLCYLDDHYDDFRELVPAFHGVVYLSHCIRCHTPYTNTRCPPRGLSATEYLKEYFNEGNSGRTGFEAEVFEAEILKRLTEERKSADGLRLFAMAPDFQRELRHDASRPGFPVHYTVQASRYRLGLSSLPICLRSDGVWYLWDKAVVAVDELHSRSIEPLEPGCQPWDSRYHCLWRGDSPTNPAYYSRCGKNEDDLLYCPQACVHRTSGIRYASWPGSNPDERLDSLIKSLKESGVSPYGINLNRTWNKSIAANESDVLWVRPPDYVHRPAPTSPMNALPAPSAAAPDVYFDNSQWNTRPELGPFAEWRSDVIIRPPANGLATLMEWAKRMVTANGIDLARLTSDTIEGLPPLAAVAMDVSDGTGGDDMGDESGNMNVSDGTGMDDMRDESGNSSNGEHCSDDFE